MGRQLALMDEPGSDYRLDERTREIGRKGVAAAREALRKAADDAARQRRKSAA